MQLNKTDLQKIIERIDLARNVYGGGDAPAIPPGWEVVTSSSPDPDKTAGFYARLYRNTAPVPGDPAYAIVFRGTHKTDWSDIHADVRIFLQQLPKQHAQALDFVKKVSAQYNIQPMNMELIGHSSGGYLARTVATVLGAHRVLTLNSPGPSAKTKEELVKQAGGDHLPPNRLFQIRAVDDIVSKWGYVEGIVLEVDTKDDFHSLAQLRKGVEDVMKGIEPKGPAKKPHPLSLTGLFNNFSQKVTRSGRVREKIHQIFGNDQPPRSSQMRPGTP